MIYSFNICSSSNRNISLKGGDSGSLTTIISVICRKGEGRSKITIYNFADIVVSKLKEVDLFISFLVSKAKLSHYKDTVIYIFVSFKS